MKTVKYIITPINGGYTVRILKRGKLAVQPQEFGYTIDCLNYVNSYCLLNNVTAKRLNKI